MDLSRDAASAFGPASQTAGALLPFEGRTLMKRPEGLPSGVFVADRDGWLTPNNPILARGEARILPLAWSGDGTGATSEEIAAFAAQMQAAGMHWAGNWRHVDLSDGRADSIGSYIAALRTAGATRVDCWTYSESEGIVLVWAGSEDAGTASLALHVVPVSWVSDARAKKPVKHIDVRWSWADVVELYGAKTLTDESES